jgi:hypothetical protein
MIIQSTNHMTQVTRNHICDTSFVFYKQKSSTFCPKKNRNHRVFSDVVSKQEMSQLTLHVSWLPSCCLPLTCLTCTWLTSCCPPCRWLPCSCTWWPWPCLLTCTCWPCPSLAWTLAATRLAWSMTSTTLGASVASLGLQNLEKMK